MPSQQIELKFSRAGKKTLHYRGTSTYRSALSSTDSIDIFNKNLIIKIMRASTSPNPLQTHNSTIYKQIVKALCLYYIFEKHPNQLREVIITTTKGRAAQTTIKIPKAQIKQIIGRTANLSVLGSIDPAKAPILLSESASGRAVLHAGTHLIKSIDSPSPFDRFEKLWRAFNALYKAFAKANTDHACHVALRNYIQNNPSNFPLSIAKVRPLTATDIRSKIRWNQMILNNYPTQTKTTAFKDSILRNSDPRILSMYQSSLPIRQTFLNNTGLYATVNTSIQAAISANIPRDSDVLSTLCIKYMYFVRNKIAHAERADHGFTFLHGSTDEAEVIWLSPFLEALVIDLINISDTF
nr:hypothetical protein [Pseudomonas sp. LPH1]